MNTSEVLGNPESLEFAGNMLERHDFQDQTPSLLDITGVAQHGLATASGLNDYDYKDLNSLSMRLKNLTQIATVNRVPIPNEIMEHFKNIKCHCMMGLFPEIGRAWLTIDSDIYIWTFEQTRDVAYFDGLSDLIVSVGMVPPLPGIFIADVKHLLILTTAVEIVVLGVTFGSTSIISSPGHSVSDEMQLLNKPIFVLSTDNVSFNVIQGTANGRIFLGGRDGNLYEIMYQAESNWFGKRCKKINHSQGLVSYMVPGFLKIFSEIDPIIKIVIDDTRELLYLLTEKGAIEAWALGADANQMHRIAHVSANDIANMAGNILKTVEMSVFKPVTAICALDAFDSQKIHLMAITHSGVRFYFSITPIHTFTTQLNSGISQVQNAEVQKPQGLYLMHIRLPPGYTPNATIGKPKQVHGAFYKNGSLIMVSTPQPDLDLLWSISSESFPMRPSLTESSTVMQLDGQVWAIEEVETQKSTTCNSLIRTEQMPRKIVLLTNQGAHIVALLKPIDFLRQLLVSCNGAHHEAVKSYFQAQQEPQACATSLSLACLEQNRSADLVQWATQAYMLYGGEPHFVTSIQQQQQQQQLPVSAIHSTQNRTTFNSSNTFLESHTSPIYQSTPFSTLRPASSVQQNLMQQTQFSGTPSTTHINNTSLQHDHINLNYSAKHAGLYIHVSRMLRHIWKKRCIDQHLSSTINQDDCIEILNDLHGLKTFLEVNSVGHLTTNPLKINHNSTFGNSSINLLQQQQQTVQKKSSEEALIEEKKSLDALTKFIRHTIEVIGLWKILCEHQFSVLLSQLPKELLNILLSCTFRDLYISRIDICVQLIVILINTYLNDNASINAISSKLREVCPTLYRHEDAVSHKATEILMLGKNCTDDDEKDERLKTALQLCKGAAPKLPLANICQQFAMAGYYQGVIDLCVTCAAKIDCGTEYETFTDRSKCYKVVCDMLESVYLNLRNGNTTLDITRGLPMDNEQVHGINQKILQIVGIALQTSDKLLHHAVYDWLLSHDLLSEMLGISEPSLGEFLNITSEQAPNNFKILDLLWKYHEKNNQHDSAAKILCSLATSNTDRINLQNRIEYLARAIMCMRSDNVGYSAHNGIFLKELEDKLEIARIQKQILDAIETLPQTNNTRDAAKSLNSSLYDMTHLYADFCEDFELWENKLVIFNSSHHNDPLMIETIWNKIFDKEMSYSGTNAEKFQRLLAKVANLSVDYGGGGHCFPLHFIVRELEVRCFRLGLIDSVVPEALLNMNLDPDVLLDIYASLISMNERIWMTEDDDLFLIRSTIKLLSITLQQSSQTLNKNRRRLAKFQDLISACLNQLYTKPNTKALSLKLREIQESIHN